MLCCVVRIFSHVKFYCTCVENECVLVCIPLCEWNKAQGVSLSARVVIATQVTLFPRLKLLYHFSQGITPKCFQEQETVAQTNK